MYYIYPIARAPAKRTHYNYELKDKGKVVYRGITTDPARRRSEHKDSGKRFTSMSVGTKVSKKTALKREKQGIQSYKSRTGRRPRHNKKG